MSLLERESPPTGLGHIMPRPAPKHRAHATSLPKGGQSYKLLEEYFQRGQFSYKQLTREQDIAIYSQTWRGCSEPSIGFEVICVRRHNGKEIKGQWVEPSEFYPSSSEWGKYGFTFTNKNVALREFRELSERAEQSRSQ